VSRVSLIGVDTIAVPRFPVGSRWFPHPDHHNRFPRFPPPLRGGEPGNCVGEVGTVGLRVSSQISNYCPSHAMGGVRRGNRSKRHRPAPRGVRAAMRRRGRFPGYLQNKRFLGGRPRAIFGDREPFWGTAREPFATHDDDEVIEGDRPSSQPRERSRPHWWRQGAGELWEPAACTYCGLVRVVLLVPTYRTRFLVGGAWVSARRQPACDASALDPVRVEAELARAHADLVAGCVP